MLARSIPVSVPCIVFVIFLMVTLISSQNPDPCSASDSLPYMDKRSPNYKKDDIALCDRHITKKWYKMEHYSMPTKAPNADTCGTTFQYWMDDEFPDSTNDSIVTVKVCKAGLIGICEDDHGIRIKNCDGFVAYELTPLDGCPSAYCFEINRECINDAPSNVEIVFHSLTWTNSSGRMTGDIVATPELKWKCQFKPLKNSSYFYEVSWIMDSREIISNQTITDSNLDDAVMSTKDIHNHGLKFNTNAQCLVGAKIKASGPACRKNSSLIFFMGIKNETPRLTIERGKSNFITFRPTIPIVDYYIVESEDTSKSLPFSSTHFTVSLSVTSDISTSCDGAFTDKSCEVRIAPLPYPGLNEIQTSSWDKVQQFEITTLPSEKLSVEASRTARLIVEGIHAPTLDMYNKILLTDTVVHVVDDAENWKEKSCTSLTDPHIKTFDSLCYECQLLGIFILYRNLHRNQEVQVKHHQCHGGYSYPYCNCAVAVRAGRAIFVVDICNGISDKHSFIDYTLCDDKVLDVVMLNEKLYKVYMPSGTVVTIAMRTWPDVSTWQIDVTINPSLSDMRNTSGLCGIMDGDQTNDFTKRNGEKQAVVTGCNYYANVPNDFSESWRIEENTSLFANSKAVYDSLNLTSISKTNIEVCKCDQGQTICNAKSSPRCTNMKYGSFGCRIRNTSTGKRRKRSPDSINVNERPHKISKKQTTVIDVSEAETICTSAFAESTTYTMCIENVASLTNSTFVNCVMDVMVTGDTNITKVHIQAAIEQCTTFVTLNTTLQKDHPNLVLEISNYCPNNCSGNGMCSSGNCSCDYPFAGSDCSFDQRLPPTITAVVDLGKCDKSIDECTASTVEGRYFFFNSNTTCHVERHEETVHGTTFPVVSYEVAFETKTLFQGDCQFSYGSTDGWLVAFSFKITNDGKLFTDLSKTYVYKSQCQVFNNDSGNIYYTLKAGYCYIDGLCIEDEKNVTEDGCSICNVSLNRFDKTVNAGCISLSSTSELSTHSAPSSTSRPTMISITSTTPHIHHNVSKLPPKEEDSVPVVAIAVSCAIGLPLSITLGIFIVKKIVTKSSHQKTRIDGVYENNVFNNDERHVYDGFQSSPPIGTFEFPNDDQRYIESRSPSAMSLVPHDGECVDLQQHF